MKIKLVFNLAFISIVGFQAHAMEKKDVTEPKARFYVEREKWHKQKPSSKFRKHGYDLVVIKAVPIKGEGTWNWQENLKVLEPKEFAEKYGNVLKERFVETEGPPRKLSHEEYYSLDIIPEKYRKK